MDEMVISIRQTLSVAREVFPVTSYPLIQGGKLSGEVAGRAMCLYFLMKSNLFVRVGKQKKYISNKHFSLKGASQNFPRVILKLMQYVLVQIGHH